MLPVSSLPLLVSPKNWVPNGPKCEESTAQQEKVMGSNPVQAKVFFLLKSLLKSTHTIIVCKLNMGEMCDALIMSCV